MRRLIVARCYEDIGWLNEVRNCDIYLYNKGETLDCPYKHIMLENEGREAHTYLYHILHNEPADYNIFVQAHPFDHCINPVYDIDNLEADFSYLKSTRGKLQCDQNGLPHHHLPLKPAFKYILGYCPETIEFTPGACFVVSKERLLSLSRRDYEKLLNLSLKPNGAWILERMWGYLWT